ncbi:MAG: SDR family oxidoreductase [Flavobacteriales bacterium]|nr:SDR family oxidoreductase [Flavobacteriales bacterium]
MSETVKKVVLVTGGSSGLGQAICTYLTRIGHTVYGTGRSVQTGAHEHGFALLPMDITDEVSIAHAVAEIVRREGHIDAVVNNAGVGIQGAAEDITPELAMRVLDTNVVGAHRVCRAVLPGMRARKSGLIINITSVAASFGLPYRAFYSASKAALERYGEALAIEVGRFGIHVVNVQPGEFKTNIAANRLRPQAITPDHKPGYEKAMSILDGSLGYSRDPVELARVVAQVIASPRPRTHYLVAQGVQRLSVLAKKLLPGRMFQRMVGKHYE